jgi:hypothetical protein
MRSPISVIGQIFCATRQIAAGCQLYTVHLTDPAQPKLGRGKADVPGAGMKLPVARHNVRYFDGAVPTVPTEDPKPFCSCETAKSWASFALATTASMPKNSCVTPV